MSETWDIRENEKDEPMPCPVCGGAFPELASHGAVTCENGHDFTMATLPGAMDLFNELSGRAMPEEEYDWDHDCVACDFTAESPEQLDRHYEVMCGPDGDDLHRVWV